MPRDLFGDLVARPPSVRSRRTPVVIVSIVAHVPILLLLIVTTLAAASGTDARRRNPRATENRQRRADVSRRRQTSAQGGPGHHRSHHRRAGKRGGYEVAEVGAATRSSRTRRRASVEIHSDITQWRTGAGDHDGDSEFHVGALNFPNLET